MGKQGLLLTAMIVTLISYSAGGSAAQSDRKCQGDTDCIAILGGDEEPLEIPCTPQAEGVAPLAAAEQNVVAPDYSIQSD